MCSEEKLRAVAEDVRKEAKAAEVSEVVVVEAQHEEPMAEEVIVQALPMMQKAGLRTETASKDKAAARPDAAMPAAAGQVAVIARQKRFARGRMGGVQGVDRTKHQVS